VGAVICSDPSGSIEMTLGHSINARQPIRSREIGFVSEIGSGVAMMKLLISTVIVDSLLPVGFPSGPVAKAGQ
jgi:hypothetical protein